MSIITRRTSCMQRERAQSSFPYQMRTSGISVNPKEWNENMDTGSRKWEQTGIHGVNDRDPCWERCRPTGRFCDRACCFDKIMDYDRKHSRKYRTHLKKIRCSLLTYSWVCQRRVGDVEVLRVLFLEHGRRSINWSHNYDRWTGFCWLERLWSMRSGL